MVVFESFQGRNISCNPKALYEEMKNNPKYKDYTLVWSLRNPNRTDVKTLLSLKVLAITEPWQKQNIGFLIQIQECF